MVDNDRLLSAMFDLAQRGIYINVNTLPDGISKDVVRKNLLYIELKNLVKTNGDPARIAEIKAILNPPEEEDYEA